MVYSNNSHNNGSSPKKRKKSKLEKSVKKEGKKALRKMIKGKSKGHFVAPKRKETDYENISQRKILKNQQNIKYKATDTKQEAAVHAALESMKPKEKPVALIGSSKNTKWMYNTKKKKYRAVAN